MNKWCSGNGWTPLLSISSRFRCFWFLRKLKIGQQYGTSGQVGEPKTYTLMFDRIV